MGATINMVRHPDSQTISKLGCLAAREGSLAAREGPLADGGGPLVDQEGQMADREERLTGRNGQTAVSCDRAGRSQKDARWRSKVRPKSFDVGQTVRVYYPRRYKSRTHKWQLYYSTVGTVVAKFNDATYLVKSESWKCPKILHCDKLKTVQEFQ